MEVRSLWAATVLGLLVATWPATWGEVTFWMKLLLALSSVETEQPPLWPSCGHLQVSQSALGMASASNHLLPDAAQKVHPRLLPASQEPSCHHKANSCSDRKVASERAGGLLTQPQSRRQGKWGE